MLQVGVDAVLFMYCEISCRSCTWLFGSWCIRREILLAARKPHAPSPISLTTFHELCRGGFGGLLVDAGFCGSGGLFRAVLDLK